MTTTTTTTTTPTILSSSNTNPNPAYGCSDSPLSITASIISLLTFALGLLASYIALQSATRGAPTEIARLVDDLRATQHEINRVAEYIFDDDEDDDDGDSGGGGGLGIKGARRRRSRRFLGGGGRPGYAVSEDEDDGEGDIGGGGGGGGGRGRGGRRGPRSELYEETQALLGNCVRLFYEADSLLKRSQADAERWHPRGLWNRVVFVMNRHEVGEKMQRLGEQKARLAALQMGVFMRKGRGQERVLGEVWEAVRELMLQGRSSSGSGSGSEGSGVFVGRGG